MKNFGRSIIIREKYSIKIIKYKVEEYLFRELISSWLNIDDLAMLHTVKNYSLLTRKKDQSTIWHKQFYKKIREDSRFFNLYKKFLVNEIQPRFGEEIVYQKIPTFRVHLPGNVSVGKYHKDKSYRDLEWAEKVKEVNYYLPLTKAHGTNTIWAETEEDKGEYKPLNAAYGEYIEWDASNLTHGNKNNLSSVTRVSFDFRIIPKSRYIDSGHLTINTELAFKIGDYYELTGEVNA